MEVFYTIVAFLGGLSMFLYGMKVMGDGLKSSSGGAMNNALAKVTGKTYMGFLLGMAVACIIQSSTATIVITVGLVGAGLLTFHQSIGIVLGANVGTAITAQIIRLMDVSSGMNSPLYFFKADNLAPMALIIGIVLIMFIGTSKAKNAGSIACGFGVLFMGLISMSNTVASFGDSMSGLLTAFSNSYPLGFLAGVLVTCVVQSSSAVIGIIQSIASSIGVTFDSVFAVIIGVNIGDCLTTYIVSRIGAKPNQRRTAMVHVIYNVFAATLIILLIFIGRTTGILNDTIWTATLNSGGVANVHGLFRLIPAVALLPCTTLFEKIALTIIKDEPVNEEDEGAIAALDALDERLFTSPALALAQVERVVLEMSSIARHNYDACVRQLYEYDPKRTQRINERESLLDNMTDAANKYIVSLSPHVMSEKDTRQQNALLKALICYERIGDLAVNITDEIDAMRDGGYQFSSNAMAELRIAFDAVYEILDMTNEAYRNQDPDLAAKVEPLEEVIDDLIEDMNARHVYRMVNQLCNAVNGIYYQGILTNVEHISDKCSDIAVYILEGSNRDILGQEHSYVHNLHHSNNINYMSTYRSDYDKYFNKLNAVSLTETIEVPEDVADSAEEKSKITDRKDRAHRRRTGKMEKITDDTLDPAVAIAEAVEAEQKSSESSPKE